MNRLVKNTKKNIDMAEKNEKKAKMNPLLAAVKPLARQYVNQDAIGQLFDRMTGGRIYDDGSKPVLVISRGKDGRIYGGHYTLGPDLRITAQHMRAPIDELLDEALK